MARLLWGIAGAVSSASAPSTMIIVRGGLVRTGILLRREPAKAPRRSRHTALSLMRSRAWAIPQAQLPAGGLRVGARGIADRREDAARLHGPRDRDDAFARWRLERQTLDAVVDDEVHVAAHAGQQRAELLDVVIAVVHSLEQRPLELHGRADVAPIRIGRRDD